jgi:divalent metal cation (Fe/Co/Zn/Cd) transporter
VSIAFLCAALALFSMGAFLLWDSIMKLISFEHPSIGVVQPFGDPIWLGWLMIPALLWSAIPAVLIGRAKIPLARELHDKVLYADSEMNKADWMTATAAIAGVLGIGLGLWWADAAAATFISLDILHDGWKNLRAVISDLMDSRPTSVDHERIDPLPASLQTHLESLEWVARARVRLREEGHVYYGEAFIELVDERDVVAKVARTADSATGLDWRLHDVVVMPVGNVDELPEPEDVQEGVEESGSAERASRRR